MAGRYKGGIASLLPNTPLAWMAFGALLLLWLGALIDFAMWFSRLTGSFSSKTNYISHFWPYISLAGAVAGLLAQGMPNILRSIPTVWLVFSLILLHGRMFFPGGSLPPLEGPILRVVTLNMGHIQEKHRAAYSFLRRRQKMDILFLQEVGGTAERGDRPQIGAFLRKRLPYSVWYHVPRKGRIGLGLGILSRYPLSDARILPLPAGPAQRGACFETVALVAKAVVKETVIRLATTHLCPPSFPWQDEWLRPVPFGISSVWSWMANLRDTEYARKSQLSYLRQIAHGGREPFILGAVLNTTPFSLDLLNLSAGLRSAFEERGGGFGFTYPVGVFGARIDHIFYAGGLRARSAEVPEVDVSDHSPLAAELEIIPPAGG
ncbi:MAG: endonuclease/exonuclease/phosphatase family protein [bacterium]